jgi:predicted NBD/HSP70 family sugar kinase
VGHVNNITGVTHSYLNFDNPLPEILTNEWGIPVYVANDTHLMALGEKDFGFAKGKRNAIIVNVNRGVGAGIISNGILHSGNSGFAGEFGHIHVADNNRLCVCGKTGCLETVVSGIALENEYHSSVASSDAPKLSYKEILQLSKKNDAKVDHILNKMGEELGKHICMLIHMLNPEAIIISGAFAQAGDKILYGINKGINLYGLPPLVADASIKISTLADTATMFGAFSLVFEKELQEL